MSVIEQTGISIFQAERIDVVVMDYWMTPMNGLAAARTMKELKPEVPIVFLSAYSELPGETIGLAKCWVRKGEDEPEHFLARLGALVGKPRSGTHPCSMTDRLREGDGGTSAVRAENRNRSMKRRYIACWIGAGGLTRCGHLHATIEQADRCLKVLGGFVRAVENDIECSLNPAEINQIRLTVWRRIAG